LTFGVARDISSIFASYPQSAPDHSIGRGQVFYSLKTKFNCWYSNETFV